MHTVTSRTCGRTPIRIAVLTLAVAGLLAAIPTAEAAAAHPPTPYGVNLVRNPGAEDGHATDGESTIPIPHWKVTGGYGTVVRYGTPRFPSKATSSGIHGGDKFFTCGESTVEGTIRTRISLIGRGAAIDGGHVTAVLRARIATALSPPDEGWVSAEFLTAPGPGGIQLLFDTINTAHVIASDDVFKLRTAAKRLPAGTREIDVDLNGLRVGNGDTYCDAYFDNIELRLKHV
jgi:hypothetical protein